MCLGLQNARTQNDNYALKERGMPGLNEADKCKNPYHPGGVDGGGEIQNGGLLSNIILLTARFV